MSDHDPASAWRMPSHPPAVRVWDLLWARWRTLRNIPTSAEEGGLPRLLLLGGLGAFVWGGIYLASYWFAIKTLGLEPFGGLMLQKLVGLVLTVFAGVLLFSNIVAAFSNFLLTDELQFLVPRAIPPNTFFSARFIESTVDASWMALLFMLPVLISIGHASDAGATYYLWIAPMMLPLALIPTALSVPFVLLLANVFPVHRTREVLVGLGVIAFVGLFSMVRSMNPERLLDPQQFGSTLELFTALQTPSSYWIPSSWASEVLVWRLKGEVAPLEWLYLSCLIATTMGCFFLSAWSFRGWHSKAYSRAQQGRPEQDSRGGEREEEAQAHRDRLKKQLARMARSERPLTPIGVIAHKDALVFARDAVQWSQLLLLVGLAAIYLLNFRYIGVLGQGSGLFGPIGVYFLNIALSSFMVAAVSVRLVFPAVSLEGRAFWLVRRAPIGLKRYLFAKWLGHIPPLLVLAEFLVVASNLMIGTPLWLTLKSVFVVGLLVVTIAGLGVGLGALFPRFHIDNAAKIATGVGGVLFMFIALTLTLVVIALDAYPTYFLMLQRIAPTAPIPENFWLKAIGIWAGTLISCAAAAGVSLWLGARRLAR